MVCESERCGELLVSLQQQLIFQDDVIDTLSDAIASQERRLLALGEQCAALQRALASLRTEVSAATAAPQDEVPPHY